MTIRVKFTDAESASLALQPYKKPEYQKEWRKYHWYSIIGFIIGYLLTTNSTPLMLRLILLTGGAILIYLLGRTVKFVGMKTGIRNQILALSNMDTYALTIKPEGLEYRCRNDVTTYGWSSFDRVELSESGFVFALMPGYTWIIPPSSFGSLEERSQFVTTMENYCRGGKPGSSWWTQGQATIEGERDERQSNMQRF